MKRIAWMRFVLVAALAVGCRSEKTVLSASEAGNGNGQPVGNTQGNVGHNAQGQGGVEWVTVVDSRESAFSVEVPKGWKASGGMFRYRIAYPRPTIEMTSPDGRTNIQLGDATIPNYQTPIANPYHLPRTPGGPPVAPFATGDVFAGKYGLARFSSMCQSVELKSSEPKQPKFGAAGQGGAGSIGQGFMGQSGIQNTAGLAAFSCEKNGEPMTGYVYAETMRVGGSLMQPANWYVTALASYLAPAAQSRDASAMLLHSGGSIAMNTRWLVCQHKIIAMATIINLNTAAEIMKEIQQTNAQQDRWRKMMAGETDDFNDILNGRTFAMDSTGRTWDVPTGNGGQQWVNGQQTVVNSAFQPGPGFTALTPISH